MHAHSTASTKRQRRRENWGKRNTIQPTHRRRYVDNAGHARPVDGLDRYGKPWRGTSTSPRPKRSTTWRDWYREAFLSMWREQR